MHIHTFALGDWMTNCYVMHKPGVRGGPCWIIDAGFSPQPMIRYIQQHDLKPEQVLLTHAHLDHIAGLDDLRTIWPDLPILIHRAEEEFLANPMLNLSAVLEEEIIAPAATGFLEQGQMLELDGIRVQVRHTPGHSPGGVSFCLLDEGLALVGDTIFAGSIGRTDFPTSDHEALMNGIRTQLLTLPDATRIFPGHGPASTIGAERRGNPYL